MLGGILRLAFFWEGRMREEAKQDVIHWSRLGQFRNTARSSISLPVMSQLCGKNKEDTFKCLYRWCITAVFSSEGLGETVISKTYRTVVAAMAFFIKPETCNHIMGLLVEGSNSSFMGVKLGHSTFRACILKSLILPACRIQYDQIAKNQPYKRLTNIF